MAKKGKEKGKEKDKEKGEKLIRVSEEVLRANLEDEPEFWQRNKEAVLEAVDDVLPLAQPFPAGWTKNAGIKVAEDADLRRINKANKGVLVKKFVPEGDYRAMYEGVYLPVRWGIYVRSDGRYDAMTLVSALFMAVQRPQSIASAVADLLVEIRGHAMRHFALGRLPGTETQATEEDMNELIQGDTPYATVIGGEPVKEYRTCMFVPLHFPEKLAQILVEDAITYVCLQEELKEHADDEFPLSRMDSLAKMFTLGKPLIASYDVEREADTWKWTRLSEYA